VIDPARITALNDHPIGPGQYVLYWMQASQRTQFNHALEHAIARANVLALPVVVCFGLMDDYPEANERHYAFMLQGLADVHAALVERGIRFVVRRGPPAQAAIHFAKHAALVVCDRGYLRHQKRWRDEVADGAPCRVEQVEADVVVPVEEASEKAEFAARTIRPKILRFREQYLAKLRPRVPGVSSLKLRLQGDVDVSTPESALAKLKLDRTIRPVSRFKGGEREAQFLLRRFVQHKLSNYARARREPAAGTTSTLSPHLHFGQISPVQIALAVRGADAPEDDKEAFLEELIVRRELAINFVHYTPHYDRFDALPAWARKTLEEHANDKRHQLYTRGQLEAAQTHDPYWNAAQREMTATGFMHNSLRMYWGKKILEWSWSPQVAYEHILYLNNKYFLCGRDPASYANVGWIFGLHDRPWVERRVFGKVRYMNAAGLKRKFDMEAYTEWVDGIEEDVSVTPSER
jgi:deoxyribodipyrimidine photo-lyase